MTDTLAELRQLAQSWRNAAGDPDATEGEATAALQHADDLISVVGEDPVLPAVAGLGQVDVTLEITLGTVVIPGDDERPEGLTLGHLVASQIAHRVMPDLADMRKEATAVLLSQVSERAGQLVDDALDLAVSSPGGRHLRPMTRRDLTLGQMLAAEVQRQLNEPSPAAAARGRMNVPVIEAIIASAVTEGLRDLTREQVDRIVGAVRADIASSGGRG
jgi:hypothetical protein